MSVLRFWKKGDRSLSIRIAADLKLNASTVFEMSGVVVPAVLSARLATHQMSTSPIGS